MQACVNILFANNKPTSFTSPLTSSTHVLFFCYFKRLLRDCGLCWNILIWGYWTWNWCHLSLVCKRLIHRIATLPPLPLRSDPKPCVLQMIIPQILFLILWQEASAVLYTFVNILFASNKPTPFTSPLTSSTQVLFFCYFKRLLHDCGLCWNMYIDMRVFVRYHGGGRRK